MKILRLLSTAAALGLTVASAEATIVTTVTPNTGGTNLMLGTGTPGFTVLQNFDSIGLGIQPPGYTPATGTTPGGGVVTAGNSGLYAAPLGDTTPFYAVAFNPATGPLIPSSDTITFGATQTYFGLYWGSIDAYNTITFEKDGVALTGGTFTGADFLPASGNQTSANTNEYIDFAFTGQAYNQVLLSTSNLNFEIDNVRNVPEPASLAIFGIALAGLGLIGRRRNRNAG